MWSENLEFGLGLKFLWFKHLKFDLDLKLVWSKDVNVGVDLKFLWSQDLKVGLELKFVSKSQKSGLGLKSMRYEDLKWARCSPCRTSRSWIKSCWRKGTALNKH